MRMLGENHGMPEVACPFAQTNGDFCVELDQDMLADVSKMQKWKNAKIKQQCREAFRRVGAALLLPPLLTLCRCRRAMAERETDEEENAGTATPATDGNAA